MDADALKAILGQQAKQIIANGLHLHQNKSGMVNCPLHNDKNPSMSWFKDGYMWRCHACEGQIDIYRYYTEFEHMTFVEAKAKVAELTGQTIFEKPNSSAATTYNKPNIQTTELSNKAIEYMEKRKITKDTLDAWDVKQRNWNGKEVYVFQYYNDKNELEYVSYRGIGKNELKGGCEQNTKPILWGMSHIDKSIPVVITEGQPDAMAVWQAGYRNVVSIPNGAKNFKWIDNCWEWLQDVKEIIYFADNDVPGIECANEVQRRLKNVKVIKSSNRKDANEVLFYDGAEKILELISEAINKMPNGLLDVSELHYDSINAKISNGIETGFYDYDSHVEDWKEEEITIVVGRNGEGKTTFISQVIAHNLEKKVKTFLYSGEMSDNKIQRWIYRQLVGNKPEFLQEVKTKYNTKVDLIPDAVKAIKEWHKETFYLFDRNVDEVSGNMDSFFGLMDIAAKRYGVKLFVIDNLMSKLEENADSLFSDQANFIQRCKNFAVVNKCHVAILVHPNKAKSEIVNGESNIEKTDISGSNNIPNKADNIIAIERNWENEREFDAIITSLKDRETGERKSIKYLFSKKTLRFYNNNTSCNATYGWTKYLKDYKPKEQQNKQMQIYEQCPF